MNPPPIHPAALDPDKLLAQCTIIRGRKSGPGGQNRNKVETAVDITHNPTTIHAAASERRSQAQNRSAAIFRLRLNLALQIRGYFQPAHSPTDLWRSRLSPQGRIAVNPKHPDFPAILAEALDLLAALKLDPAAASQILSVTTSQLIKLLKLEPQALHWLNEQRKQHHLHPLH
jgi:hypothetical protein